MSEAPTQMLTEYQLGQLINPKQRVRPEAGASTEEWKRFEWPIFCHKMKKKIDDEQGRYYVPPLLAWAKDDEKAMESYTVGLPAAFDTPIIQMEISEYLRSTMGATEVATVPVKNGHAAALLEANGFQPMTVVRIVLSFFDLPSPVKGDPSTWLRFDPANVPASDDQVYFGTLSEGSDLIWDTRGASPHALSCGGTGSGKSEAVALGLMQLHHKGWHLIILSPDEGDTTYKEFADLGHDVVMGSELQHYEQARDLFAQLVEEEMPARGRERGEQSVNVWGDRPDDNPDYQWRGARHGKKIMVVAEECGDWFNPGPGDTPEEVEIKQYLAVCQIAFTKKGRKYRIHEWNVTQQPYVAMFGGKSGGEALRNIGFRLAVRTLDKTFLDIVFPNTQSPAVQRVMLDPTTPQGRAICRGAEAPDNEFGGQTNDTPVQCAFVTPEERAAYLARPVGDWGDGAEVAPAVEPDEAPAVEPDGQDPDGLRLQLVASDGRALTEEEIDEFRAGLDGLAPADVPPPLAEQKDTHPAGANLEEPVGVTVGPVESDDIPTLARTDASVVRISALIGSCMAAVVGATFTGLADPAFFDFAGVIIVVAYLWVNVSFERKFGLASIPGRDLSPGFVYSIAMGSVASFLAHLAARTIGGGWS